MSPDPQYLSHVAVHYNLSFLGPHSSRINVQGDLGEGKHQKLTHDILAAIKSVLEQANLVNNEDKLLKAELKFQYCDLDE